MTAICRSVIDARLSHGRDVGIAQALDQMRDQFGEHLIGTLHVGDVLAGLFMHFAKRRVDPAPIAGRKEIGASVGEFGSERMGIVR